MLEVGRNSVMNISRLERERKVSTSGGREVGSGSKILLVVGRLVVEEVCCRVIGCSKIVRVRCELVQG